ncbi:hypothetical protein SAMN04488693_1265 [Arthrobacter subterraneus]|uniref:Acetyltransferase (GNAT) domain-containing protein n=1 Tax=Arthrobacter subterraneus TaxID=335973 RepID=A0A1G8NSW9_9MICC|nr:hypothetical protein [Arthrobacter subterraneus]SDI83381.1 hypothetical protein SAMN04488693_1265 [Arthrobacter subterraneus]
MKPSYEIRATATRHAKDVINLAYASFPFEKENEREALGSQADVLATYREMLGRTGDGFQLVAVDKKDKVIGLVAVRPLQTAEGRQSMSVFTIPRIGPQQRTPADC